MVDYARFNVDPGPYQQRAFQNLLGSAAYRNERQDAAQANAMAERQYQGNMLQRQVENQRADRAEQRVQDQSELELVGVQADVIKQALGTVQTPQDWDSFKGWMNQLGQSPLGQGRFFQSLVGSMPPDYNPQKVQEAIRNLDTVIPKQERKQGYSEAELTQRAIRGDKEAQQILDRMTSRKMQTARAGKTDIKNFMGTIPPGYAVEYDKQGRPASMKAIPGGPAAGEISPREKKETAQNRVSNILSELGTMYEDLGKQGAIVDIERDSVDNIISRIGASGVGQAASGAVGSRAQSTRNKINQMRPLLINYIRQASEMGARGLDSEKELEFYLKAATDPTVDIQSNMNALRVLDDAYGLGMFGKKPTQQPKQAQPRKTGPSYNEWIQKARQANPGVSDSELRSYYDKKYRSQNANR